MRSQLVVVLVVEALDRPLCVDPDVSTKLIAGQIAQAPAYEYSLKLSEEEKVGLSRQNQQVAQILAQQAFFFLTLIDMAEKKDPGVDRSLPEAQKTLSDHEDGCAQRLNAETV